MLKRVIILTAVLAAALSAQSIRVELQDFHNNLSAIASKLSLTLGLPGGGLSAVISSEAKSIGDMGSFAATFNNVGTLEEMLGSKSGLGRGDFAVFTPTSDTAKWRTAFFTKGSLWSSGELKIHDAVMDFMSACKNSGINIPGRNLALLNGVTLVGTIIDPAAFRKGFKGTDEELQRGQTVFLMPGKSGTQAVTAHASDMPIWGFQVKDGKVTIVK